MGDMNAKVGSLAIGNIVGKFGLGERNERGERMIQFCTENKLTICNTWFQHHVRKRYTWKSPVDITRNQIDYIMVNERFKNSIKQAKAMPEADISSDHIPFKIKMSLKLKNLRKVKVKEQLELELLQQPEYRDKYNTGVRNRCGVLGNVPSGEQVDEETAENSWAEFKHIISEALKISLPTKSNTKRRHRMTQDILDKMKRRKAISSDRQMHKQLSIEIENDCKTAKEKWLNDKCHEIEELQMHFRLKEMHNKVN